MRQTDHHSNAVRWSRLSKLYWFIFSPSGKLSRNIYGIDTLTTGSRKWAARPRRRHGPSIAPPRTLPLSLGLHGLPSYGRSTKRQNDSSNPRAHVARSLRPCPTSQRARRQSNTADSIEHANPHSPECYARVRIMRFVPSRGVNPTVAAATYIYSRATRCY